MKHNTRIQTTRSGAITTTILIAFLLISCSSGSSWEETQQTNTYQAYQTYIESNPEGEHVDEAWMRADFLYWDSVATDTTTEVFEFYLDNFPEGQFRAEAQAKIDLLTTAAITGPSSTGRVTGSGVIIRSDHTTSSSSAGVVAREGTIVEILDRYIAGNSVEALLKNSITVQVRGQSIELPAGKAIRIMSEQAESVHANFITTQFGRTEATISKNDIEALEGETWYQIQTTDDITGWIFGRFIEEI